MTEALAFVVVALAMAFLVGSLFDASWEIRRANRREDQLFRELQNLQYPTFKE